MSEARKELRQLVDVLPARKIRQARSYLNFLLTETEGKTVLLRMKDDELSTEDISDIASARTAVAEGRVTPWTEAKKALELRS